jgi:hypothetical protein
MGADLHCAVVTVGCPSALFFHHQQLSSPVQQRNSPFSCFIFFPLRAIPAVVVVPSPAKKQTKKFVFLSSSALLHLQVHCHER